MKKIFPIILSVIVVLLTITSATAQEDSIELNFYFVAMSDAGVDDDGVHHRLIMSGSGEFNSTGEDVVASRTFQHVDFASGAPSEGTPMTILGSGKWEAERVVSFSLTEHPDNPYGQIVAGIVEMEVLLFPEGGDADGMSATLRVVCNVPPAGISTGEPEGYFFEISMPDGSLSFEPTSWPDTSFPLGLTLITLGDTMD